MRAFSGGLPAGRLGLPEMNDWTLGESGNCARRLSQPCVPLHGSMWPQSHLNLTLIVTLFYP